jgi:hypothetical protein
MSKYGADEYGLIPPDLDTTGTADFLSLTLAVLDQLSSDPVVRSK